MIEGRAKKMVFGRKDCPFAKASLICGVIWTLLFGIFSIPVFILGFSARILIADPLHKYKENGIASSGIIFGLTGIIVAWGIWLISLM